MEISVGWVLGAFGILCGVVSTLAGIIYKLMTSRLAAQDKIIEHLKGDVDRLSKGCGVEECLWKKR